MTEDQIRDLLREMRDEPVPADSAQRVRQTVSERIQARGWLRLLPLRWKVAAVLAGAACIALLVVSTRVSSPGPEPVPPAVARQQAPPVNQPGPSEARVRPTAEPIKLRAKRAPRVENAAAPSADVLIRIETPDPDVVILLVGGE